MSFDSDRGLIYLCRASCFQNSKGSAHFKDGEGESSPGEEKCVAQGHRVPGEIRFQTIPFALARCLSRNSMLSKLEDEFHLRNVKMEGEK